jgi:sulfur-oxidizing protein SoxY
MIANRRQWLQGGAAVASLMLASGVLGPVARAAGMAAGKGAFEAKSVAEAFKALGYDMPIDSPDITITAPDIAENGAVVPVAAATTLPGVKQMLFLVEKNPAVLAAVFNVSPDVDANIATRVKMGQSSNVLAVVVTNDNKVFYAQKDIKVTLGGCGG